MTLIFIKYYITATVDRLLICVKIITFVYKDFRQSEVSFDNLPTL